VFVGVCGHKAQSGYRILDDPGKPVHVMFIWISGDKRANEIEFGDCKIVVIIYRKTGKPA
jgi:hypothetical protein